MTAIVVRENAIIAVGINADAALSELGYDHRPERVRVDGGLRDYSAVLVPDWARVGDRIAELAECPTDVSSLDRVEEFELTDAEWTHERGMALAEFVKVETLADGTYRAKNLHLREDHLFADRGSLLAWIQAAGEWGNEVFGDQDDERRIDDEGYAY